MKFNDLFIILSLFLVTFFFLNRLTPFSSDDFVYHYFFDGKYYVDASFARILQSPGDICKSLMNHYVAVNGRLAPHFLAFLFSSSDKAVWDMANSVCFLATVLILVKLSGCRKKDIPYFCVFLFCLFWLLSPHPGHTFLWMTGSCNYLWSTLITLGFLYALFSEGWVKYAALPLALLSGNAMEGISIGLAAALCGDLLLRRKNRSPFHIAATCLFLIGVVSNVCAPGTVQRLAEQGDSATWMKYPVRLALGGGMILRHIPLFIPSIVLWLVTAILLRRDKRRFTPSQDVFYLLTAAMVSLLAVTYSLSINPRSVYGFFLFSFMAFASVLASNLHALGKWKNTILVILCLFTGLSFICAAYDIRRGFASEHSLFQDAMHGKQIIERKKIAPFLSHYYCLSDLHPSILALHNRAAAAYYGIPRFAVMEESDTATLKDIPEDAWEKAAPGKWLILPGELILTSFEPSIEAVTCAAFKNPHDRHTMAHRLKMQALGWKLGDMSPIIVPRNGNIYAIVKKEPETDIHVKKYRKGSVEEIVLTAEELNNASFLSR